MRTEESRRGCVVVLEQDAPWPDGVFGSTDDRDGVVVVHAEPNETEQGLLERVLLRCAAQARAGVRFHTAMLCCADHGDVSRSELRTKIACGLLSQLLSTTHGKLVLVTDDRRGPTANGLLGLAGVLVESLAGSHVSINVRAESRALPARPSSLSTPASVRSARPRRRAEQLARARPRPNLLAATR